MLRIGFVTCVQLGLSCMQAIYEVGGELQFAMTLRDDLAVTKSGRIYLDDFCSQRHVTLCKIRNINDPDAVSAIAAADLDWLFIVGWSQIAGAAVLGATRLGVLGMHPTLLPIGRGRAPIPWAILLGLHETGVTLFELDEGVDTGPVIAQHVVRVEPRETAATLYSRIDSAHVTLLKECWAALTNGELLPREQNHGRATCWAARKPDDGKLMQTMSVFDADRLIRAVTHPYPGAYIEIPEGRLRVWASGAPFENLEANDSHVKVRRLYFKDGWLDVTEEAVEKSI